MQRFEIQPVASSQLPEVASFLLRWREETAHSDPDAALRNRHRTQEPAASLERRLQWLLLENPASREGTPLGFCMRDSMGVMRGLLLCFPAAFVAGEQGLTGLGSGSFFVEPAARSMGFYLFKQYLSLPGYSFYFATTCNANSSALWNSLGGQAAPNSETESILPLRLDGLMPALAARRTSSKAAASAARILGTCGNPLLRLLTRRAAGLTVEPCRDWEKLSALAQRHRALDHITSNRSAAFLQWRYGSTSPLHASEVYLFRDREGNEGWFSLGNLIRGEQEELRGSVLIDAVWPRGSMNFPQIFREIVRLTSRQADALFLRSQPGFDYRECSRCVVPYRLPAPRVFVKMPKGAPMLDLSALDYDDSDFGAWRFGWRGAQPLPEFSPARRATESSAVRQEPFARAHKSVEVPQS